MTGDRIRELAGRYKKPAKLALSLVGAVALAWILANPGGRGTDAYSYWYWNPAEPYREAFGNVDASFAFRYAPPIGLLLLPGHALSFPAFLWVWTAILIGALAWLCRSWTLAAVALYPVLLEISVGNVHLLVAAAIVLGFRFPEAWSFVLLTKISPGVGLAWYAVRREWTNLARALGFTAAVAIVSFLVEPAWWSDWLTMLRSDIGLSGGTSVPIPLVVRLPIALVLVAWGARTDRRWTVSAAAFLALPTIWPQGFAVLVGIVPFVTARESHRGRAVPPVPAVRL
jgi:Glycosyltransferase family 87